jgi:Siphovirus Gp157
MDAKEFPMDQLSHSLTVYRSIRERIIALEADIDEATLADTLEGCTDLNEAVAAVVRSALEDEAMAEGLRGHIEVLQDRFRRLGDRASRRRAVARDAMIEIDLRKIAAPDFTVSVRPGSPALVVTDESAIPASYWQAREPRLDRLELIRDLKTGIPIAGASLSNPEPVLSVRVK